MKRIGYLLFVIVSAVLVIVPALTTNIKPDQTSVFDNRKLREFPALHDAGSFRSGVEEYLQDRIGFRSEMITAYQKFCDIAFHKLVHPSYIYGKGEHIIAPWDLVTYQHLDVDEEYIENFTDYLQSLERFCEDQGAEFLFYLCPNKETVYPETFPDGYNVKNQPNRSDRLLARLDEKNVSYLYPKDLFLSLKDKELLYNIKYDTGHWNETGAFYGHQQIIEHLNGKFPEMGKLTSEEFEISQIRQESLLVSYFEIDEMVPNYALINTNAVADEDYFKKVTVVVPNGYYSYYKNEVASQREAPKVLIFGDSYFGGAAKYYFNHSAELLLLHAENMPCIEYYISVFQPDIVIYEAVERVLQGSVDEFKKTKRHYNLRELQSNAKETSKPYAEQIQLDVDWETLKSQTHTQEIVSLSGSLGEAKSEGDLSNVFMLVAVLNGREYYSIFDKDKLSYQFSFRAEDVVASSEVMFYVLKEGPQESSISPSAMEG